MPVRLSFEASLFDAMRSQHALSFSSKSSLFVRERVRECVRKMVPVKSAEPIERPLQEKIG